MMAVPQATFRALADPTRRDIVHMLAQGDKTIGEGAQCFDMTRPAVKKHLTVLHEGGLIEVIPRGRERLNRLHRQGLRPVVDWLTTLDAAWDDRLSALKSAIEKDMT